MLYSQAVVSFNKTKAANITPQGSLPATSFISRPLHTQTGEERHINDHTKSPGIAHWRRWKTVRVWHALPLAQRFVEDKEGL